MFIRNSLFALAAVLAGSTAALAAQTDGDNNAVPGVQQPAAFHGAFASARMPSAMAPRTVTRTMVLKIEIDGDGNMVIKQR